MAISDATWDGSPSNWPDTGDGRTANYCRSCAINMNDGDPSTWTQDNCKLPYKFPNGDISTVSIVNCAAALNGGRGGLKNVPADVKTKAAKTILNAYHQANKPPPDALKNMAS